MAGVLVRWFRPPAIEQRLEPSRSGLAALADSGLLGTAAGVGVGQHSVLSLTASFACVRLLASSAAMLPLKLYEQRPDGGKSEARRHPVYNLLHDDPNPEMSDYELRQTLVAHLLSWGNAYAEIEFDQRGYAVGLWPLRPDHTTPSRVDGDLIYDTWVPGMGMRRLPGYRVLHLRGLGSNGLVGYSMIRLHAETFGYALATKLYGSYFFGNGSRPGIVLKHPGALGDKAYERLRQSFTAAHEGLENSHRVKILEEGMDLTAVGIPPNEAQFLETQKFQVADVARIYGVPPHMIGDVDGSTSWGSGIEQMSIGFAVYTLQPWLTAIEKSLRRALLVRAERGQFVIEHVIDGLLRGDQKSRYEAYNIGRQGGWLSVNDVRKLENMNPVDGGDVYLQPLNMVAAGTVADTVPEPDGEDVRGGVRAVGVGGLPLDERANGGHGERCGCGRCGPSLGSALPASGEQRAEADEAQEYTAGQRRRLAATYTRLFEDGHGRLLRRELADVRRAVQKYLIKGGDVAAWRAWLDEFYAGLREAAPEYLAATMATVAEQVAESVTAERGEELSTDGVNEVAAFEASYLDTWAGGYVASHNRQLAALTDEGEADGVAVAERIGGRLDGWEETEAERQAQRNAFEAVNAVTVAVYGALGVRYLMWMATGDSCPFCRGMSGKVVSIQAYFVDAGGTVTGTDGQSMTLAGAKRHGPLHEGCDCVVVAV